MKLSSKQLEISNLLEAKKFNDCLPLIQKELIDNPEDFLSYYHMGMYSIATKSFQEAMDNLIKASELDVKKNYNYNQFISFCCLSLGDICLNNKNFKDAESFYNKSLDYSPNYIGGLHALGNFFYLNNDYKKSEDYFNKAIDVNPRFYMSLLGMAFLKKNLNDIDSAIDYAEKCLEVSPNYFKANYFLGIIYFEKNDFVTSLKYLQESQLIEPNNSSVLKYIIFCHISNKDFDKAYNILDTYLDNLNMYDRSLYSLYVYLDYLSNDNSRDSFLDNSTSFIRKLNTPDSLLGNDNIDQLVNSDANIQSFSNCNYLPVNLSQVPNLSNFISSNFEDYLSRIIDTNDSINKFYPKSFSLTCFKVFNFSNNVITPLMDPNSLYNVIYFNDIKDDINFDVNFKLDLNSNFENPDNLMKSFSINKNSFIFFPSFYNFTITNNSSSEFSYYIFNFLPKAN